ncbi:pyruvate dehydrogenase E2 component (dihydrolipoamide acetyltransferase)/2-oxoglutarate dehydrogenase E2 component (dihydrolipoamide succinyltransferase) [Rhodovulum imhoffii]|uniref:Pyruvate dehydrogenase E2 component (Dihydrolipoamide acetyltransferase)/2-oxoglutarate dehydrogenase E2 component (Dihydrolipoamide succinyltransferase) n=1 Tax=Rhodovulum imhoffii TaxID=365340 RepID=A0A2T5BPU4_9RHOB|nr:biotin/lipoyl-containing protein [Rhodovulum imhoffii]MBK5933578.1 pyruvate dehydrogenase [Rhodovulum imhoffii]PTN01017.1 pyruvate dehydrogenase E2 component (dihydrolipoamide acetyltransferase)/2-oxoglutarate dehydrogenase E2 component (dihydrolipoamide succinyltransferase) [Rhodovulum imhoffii]
MPHEVLMPALGMAQDTGLIVSWLKRPGDKVRQGDALFEVETDKATMEVEAAADGYLTDVQADAGAEVPVGRVIALISETAEDSGTVAQAAEAPKQAADTLPKGAEVIMPALGMAQDTGLIVAWHKAPGDAVAAGDILFEVETDKSTMEVEAGQDGYVAALLAEAGEEAPVGEVIAVISAGKPAVPVQRSLSVRSAPRSTQPAKADRRTPLGVPAPASGGAPRRGDGRILASPKVRRVALAEGLDLTRLVDAGHSQPFHMRDLETLRAMKGAGPAVAAGQAAVCHLTAQADDGITAFAAWASGIAGITDTAALLAGLAAGSLGRDAVIVVERFGRDRCYKASALLGETVPADARPVLRLRDLRGSPVRTVHMGAEDLPVLTLTGAGSDLTVTLECAAGHLEPGDALVLLSNFAGRISEPLRHLL